MKRELCQRYLEDPEAHSGHLAECAECREVFGVLDARVENVSVRVAELPLAPWEGAAHRPWPLVIAGGAVVLALAAALFFLAGASPLLVISQAIREWVELGRSLVQIASGVVRDIPLVIVVSFVVVNAILIALLRRAPKGVDV